MTNNTKTVYMVLPILPTITYGIPLYFKGLGDIGKNSGIGGDCG